MTVVTKHRQSYTQAAWKDVTFSNWFY